MVKLHADDCRARLRPPSSVGLPDPSGLDPDVATEKQVLQVCCVTRPWSTSDRTTRWCRDEGDVLYHHLLLVML